MSFLYHTFIYDPLYNGIIFAVNIAPWLDAGLLVIIFTLVVKLILFPLSKKAVRTQIMIRLAADDLKKIKEKYKDRQEQALKTMQYYKDRGIKPFSNFLLLLVQIPILIALYHIFIGGFSNIDQDILYSFVSVPESINTIFLGLIDVTDRNYFIAILAAITQFFYAKFSIPKPPEKKTGGSSFSDDMARNMHIQMRYVFPFIIFFISYYAGAALAIYWTTSNLFMIGQELVIRRQFSEESGKSKK